MQRRHGEHEFDQRHQRAQADEADQGEFAFWAAAARFRFRFEEDTMLLKSAIRGQAQVGGTLKRQAKACGRKPFFFEKKNQKTSDPLG
jgi:hypothetical protein